MSNKPKKMCVSPREKAIMNVCNKEQSDFKGYATFEIAWHFLSRKSHDELIVQEEDIDMFLQLLDDAVIQEFFKNDTCSQLADRYLLAMVFTYFKRAQYSTLEFTRYNFFVALFLAHDIEEDDEDLKSELYIWALGTHWQQHYQDMLTSREALWMAMDHRAIVSRICCEKVMALRPNHPAWQRHRAEVHSGAIRPYAALKISCYCQSNKSNSMTEVNDSGIFESSDETASCCSDISRVTESPLSSLDVCDIFLSDSVLGESRLRRYI